MFKTGDVVKWFGIGPAIGFVKKRVAYSIINDSKCYELIVPNSEQVYSGCSEKYLTKITIEEENQFISKYIKFHPFYIKDHGDMEGWRYLGQEEEVLKRDELFVDSSKEWFTIQNWTSGQQFPGCVYRRKIDLKSNVVITKVYAVFELCNRYELLAEVFGNKGTAELLAEKLRKDARIADVKELQVNTTSVKDYREKIKSEVAAKALQKLTTEEIEALGLQK